MTHDEAFLQAILDDLDDDTTRLVYADWLEEQGDLRGEFIRVQCHLATMAGDDRQRPQLKLHECQLLERHQEQWLGELRSLLSGWTYRRGFLDAISVPAAVYMRYAAFPRPATVRRLQVDLKEFTAPADALELLPESVVYANVLLPLGIRNRTLVVAVQDPLDAEIGAKLEFMLNRPVEVIAAPEQQVAEAIRRHFGDPVFAAREPDPLGWLASPAIFPPDEVDLGCWDNGSPSARLLARLIAAAIGLNAREVRIEPRSDRIHVRYLCDEGSCGGEITPIHLHWAVVTRLRVMAGISLGESREEQAGTIRPIVRGRRIDVGVAFRQTDDGPGVVLWFRPLDSALDRFSPCRGSRS